MAEVDSAGSGWVDPSVVYPPVGLVFETVREGSFETRIRGQISGPHRPSGDARSFKLERQRSITCRVEPLQPHRMPALRKGKRRTLLDRTVQSVVVDIGIVRTNLSDRESTPVVARQVKLIDPGLADPEKALKDETTVFITGSRAD